jgi:hypothetical protein
MVRALVVLLSLLACVSASAQTLDEIVAKHVQARGGLERVRAVESVRIVARDTPAGVLYPETTWLVIEARRPCLLRTTWLRVAASDYLAYLDRNLTSPAAAGNVARWVSGDRHSGIPESVLGATRASGSDGTTGWTWTPARRAVGALGRGTPCEFILESPLTDAAAKGNTLELIGTRKIEGHQCWQIRVSGHGTPIDVYLDEKTFLEVADDRPTADGVPLRRLYTAWTAVNGIWLPFTTGTQATMAKWQRIISTVELNARIDDRRFAPPEPEK